MISSFHKEKKWYAVYTGSRAEKKVFERLQTAGYESFLPLFTTVKQWSDRKKKVEVPLINSYVFICVNPTNFPDILGIPGVISILKYLGKPAVIKDVEIENLRILSDNSNQIKSVEPVDLSEGEEIEVIKGPFSGLFAKYIQSAGRHRVVVSVEALNSFVEVSISISNIRKIIL